MTTYVPALDRKSAILSLRAKGLGYGAIAEQVGCSRGYAQQVIKKLPSLADLPPGQEIIDSIVEIRTNNPSFGPMQIRAILLGVYPGVALPSESSIGTLIKASGLAYTPIRFSNSDRRRWQDDLDHVPGSLYQIDTVKVRREDYTNVEILTCVDWHTRRAWAVELVDVQNGMSSALLRCFAVLGVPEALQIDNGFGMISSKRGHLSAFQNAAFGAGVSRITYIPPAEPQRQGRVEKWHDTLKITWGAARSAGAASFDLWLKGWLDYYNNVKPHSALGGKRARTTPGSLGQYLPDHSRLRAMSAPARATTGILSFYRLVDRRGLITVNAPAMLIPTSQTLYGHYARVDLPLGSAGSIWADGRAVGIIPDHPWCAGWSRRDGLVQSVLDPDVDDLAPVPYSADRLDAHLRRHLKQSRPVGVPAGMALVDDGDDWLIVDIYGEIVYSSQCYAVEHAEDVLSLGS